jgi:hypothetical protein
LRELGQDTRRVDVLPLLDELAARVVHNDGSAEFDVVAGRGVAEELIGVPSVWT